MYRLAFDLHKTPAEIRAMPASDFAGLQAYYRFQHKLSEMRAAQKK